jgi:hypothetical protein
VIRLRVTARTRKGRRFAGGEAQHGEDRDGVDDGDAVKAVLERSVDAGDVDERPQDGEHAQDEREQALA